MGAHRPKRKRVIMRPQPAPPPAAEPARRWPKPREPGEPVGRIILPQNRRPVIVVVDAPRSPPADASVETARRDLLRGGKTLLAAGPEAFGVFRIGDLQAVRELKQLVADIEANIEAELERIDASV